MVYVSDEKTIYKGIERRYRVERREKQRPFEGTDRRIAKDRRNKKRIPIFAKVAVLSILQILVIVIAISLVMLIKQKQQFIDQLMSLGVSIVNITAKNAPDKILVEEDVSLFQLVNDIAVNEEVDYALILDNENRILAHSSGVEHINMKYELPINLKHIEKRGNAIIGSFADNKKTLLLFRHPVTYQNFKVGDVLLVLSQHKIDNAIRTSTYFIGVVTVIVLLIGLMTSVFFSFYLSRPIASLKESAQIIGDGDFSHRVNIKRYDELGDLGMAFNQMAYGLGEREMIRETFGKYVTPEIRDQILSGNIPLNGERREATLLFSDLRDFTPYVERNEPEVVIRGMRSYFTAMQKAIKKNGGLVLQYIGDEIMAVFGVPISVDDHAKRAVDAALDMRSALDELNIIRKEEGCEPFRHGVGIYTGNVLAGNTGSDDRLSYTLIGDTVNLASRIQSMTKIVGCDILVHEGAMQGVEHHFKIKKENPCHVKGYSKSITVYRVL